MFYDIYRFVVGIGVDQFFFFGYVNVVGVEGIGGFDSFLDGFKYVYIVQDLVRFINLGFVGFYIGYFIQIFEFRGNVGRYYGMLVQ